MPNRIQALFPDNPPRAVWDATAQKWWFSVVDVVAAILDCDHKAARNYWKVLNNQWQLDGNQLVRISNQLKFPAPDGKMYFSSAMDFHGLLRLIMAIPSPKAEPLRVYFADMLAENTSLSSQFAELGVAYHNQVRGENKTRSDIENAPGEGTTLLKTTVVTEMPMDNA